MKRTGTVFFIILLLLAVSAGCGKSRQEEPIDGTTVESITQAVRDELGEHYVRMPASVQKETLSALLGIDPEHVEEYAGDFSLTMSSADSFIAIRAKDGYGDEVRLALEKRRAEVEQSFRQYLPGPLEVAKAGQVLQKGDYVFLIMLGSLETDPKLDVARAEEIIEGYFRQ